MQTVIASRLTDVSIIVVLDINVFSNFMILIDLKVNFPSQEKSYFLDATCKSTSGNC